jgi:hypothetical protein
METTVNSTMKQVIVVAGASSGFGALAARALAGAGHIVYASMRETGGRNAAAVKAVEGYASERKVDLRAIEPEVPHTQSIRCPWCWESTWPVLLKRSDLESRPSRGPTKCTE